MHFIDLLQVNYFLVFIFDVFTVCLQDDVTSLRQARDSVMEELTILTEKLERLEASNEKYKDLKEKYDVSCAKPHKKLCYDWLLDRLFWFF